MKKIVTLKINPIIRAMHYQYYFNVSESTAYRMLKADKKVLDKRFMTYADFFYLHMAFPDPKFNPVWLTMTYVDFPPKVSKMAVSVNHG